MVTLANSVPADGFVTVKMPTGYPTTSDTVILQPATDYVNRTIASSVSSDSLVITISLAGLGFGLYPTDPPFNVYVFGVKNPSTVASVSGLTVNTKLSTGLRVNEGKASITTKTASTITFPASPITQSVTKVNGIFLLGLNAILPSMYPSGGYIEVYLSKYVKISTASAQCVFGNGWSSFSSGSCALAYNSVLKRIYIVGSTAYPSSLSIELSIANVKLPPEIRTLDPILIKTYGADGNLMSVSAGTETSMIMGLTAGSVTGLVLTRVAGNTINRSTRITAAVTFADPFNQLSMVRLVLPVEQILVSGTVYGVGSYVCSVNSAESTSLQNTVDCYASDSVGWCDSSTCPAGTTISITLAGFKTPAASYPYVHTVVASIYHYDYPTTTPLFLVDTTSVTYQFSALDPESVTDFAFSITGSRLAGEVTSYKAVFTTITTLPAVCGVYLAFPEYFAYSAGGSLTVEILNYGTAVDYYAASGSIKRINITNACSTDLPAGTSFTFVVNNVRNAPNTVPTTYSLIMVVTEDGKYGMLDRGLNTNADIALTANAISGVTISLVEPIVAGASESCSVRMAVTNAVPKAAGSVVVSLPAETAIGQKNGNPTSCQIQIGSVVGVCEVTNSQTVTSTLSSISALGTAGIEAGATVTISINYLRNPQVMKTSSSFKLATYVSSSGVPYLIDRCDSCGTITPTQANVLSGVSIMRNETVVNNAVNLTFGFKLYNPVPASGYIVLHVPLQGAVVGAGGTGGIVVQSLSAPYGTLTRQVTSSASEIVIEIPQFCDVSSGCAAGAQLSLAVTGLQNPNNAVTTSYYFQIHTEDKKETTYYGIDSATNIVATPEISAGQLGNVKISRSLGTTLFSAASYTIDFTITNAITSDEGLLYILPYTETMMLSSATNVPACSISQGSGDYDTNVATVTCSATTKYIAAIDAYEISAISMSLKCPSNICASGLVKRVVLSNVLNSFRTAGQGSFVLKTVLTSTSGVVDAGTTIGTSLSVLDPARLLIGSATRSTGLVDAQTVIGITATNGVNYETRSSIYVKVYTTQFAVSGTLECSASVNGSAYVSAACSKIEQTEDYVKISVSDPCGTSPCYSGSVIGLKLTGFANAHSAKTKDKDKFLRVQIYGKSTGVLVEESDASSFDIVPALSEAAIEGIGVSFGSTLVGELSYLDVKLMPRTGLLANDLLVLNMDSQLFYATAFSKCFKVGQTTETEISCTMTSSTAGYVSKVELGAGLLPWTTNTELILRLRSVKNIPSVVPYSGNLKVSALDSSSNPIASGTLSLSTLPTIQPATLTNPTLTRSSIELGASTTLIVSFALTAEIPTGGYLIVKLPLDQAVYSGSETCTLGANAVPCSVDNTTSPAVLQIKQICPVSCGGGLSLSISAKGFRNPGYSYADAVLAGMKTYTGAGEVVHSADDLSVLPSLRIPEIVFSGISNSNPYTNQVATYSWTITMPKPVPSGGLLIFTIPQNIMMMVGSSSLPRCMANSTKYECTFTYSGQSITKVVFTDLCAGGCAENAVYQISLENVKNPESTVPLSGSMVGMATFSAGSGLIINQGNFDFGTIANVLNPTVILSAGVIRGSAVLGAVTTLTLWFAPPDAIPASGKISYMIPAEYVELLSTTKCYISGTSTQLSFVPTRQQSSWTFTLAQFCDSASGCPANTNVSILLTNVQNPTLLASNNQVNSLSITTITSLLYSIDAALKGLFVDPLLDSETLDSAFVGLLSTYAGTYTSLYIQFAPSATLSPNCNLVIDTSGVTLANTISASCARIIDGIPASKDCVVVSQNDLPQNITVQSLCYPVECPAGGIITLRLPYQNLPYMSTLTGSLRLYARIGTTTDSAYGKASVNLQIVANSVSEIGLDSSECYTTGTLCGTLVMSMQLFNQIPSSDTGGGKLKVVIPADFDFSQTTCTAAITGPIAKTLSSCVLNAAAGVVTVSDSSYLIPELSKLAITFAKLKLPASTKPTQKFDIVSSLLRGTATTIIDSNSSYYYTTPMPLPIPASGVSFVRSATTVGSAANFSLSLQLQTALLSSGSYVIIEVPNDTDVELVSETTACSVKSGTASLGCVITANSTHAKLAINYGSLGGSSVSLIIPPSVMRNKAYYNPSPGALTVFTSYDAVYPVQRTTAKIVPALERVPITASLARESDFVSISTALYLTLSVSYTLLPSTGFIGILFSDNLVLPSNTSILQCSIASTPLACAISTFPSGYINALKIYGACPSHCGADSSNVTVTIEGLRNSYASLHVTGEAKVWTASYDGYEVGIPVATVLGELRPVEFSKVQFVDVAASTRNVSNRLMLIYSPISLDNAWKLLIRFNSQSGTGKGLLTSPGIKAMLPGESLAKGSISEGTNLTIEGLFPVKGDREGVGQVYAARIEDLFQRTSEVYSLTADLSLVTSTGELFGYKQNITLTIGVLATSCSLLACDQCLTGGECIQCRNSSSSPNLQSSSCVSTCGSGFFQLSAHCINCFDSNCAQCENNLQGSCSYCNPPYYVKDGQCVSSCGTGAIATNNSEGIARCSQTSACGSLCAGSCSADSDYCFGCSGSLGLVLGTGECLSSCPEGYYNGSYLNHTSCLKCDFSCASCNQTYCYKCQDFYERFLDTTAGKCATTCPVLTYANSTTRVCEACNGTCYKCVGPTATNCTACTSPRYLYQSQCLSECPDGFDGNAGTHTCDIEAEKGTAKDLWPISLSFLVLTIIALAVCKVLVATKILALPYNILDAAIALITAVDTINRILLVSDAWNVKSTALFTFACGNLILNSMATLMFHASFFQLYLRTDGTPKTSPAVVHVITYMSYVFGHNFYRLLVSGFFFKAFDQPFRKNPEHERESMSMGKFVMGTNVAQMVIYACSFAAKIVGTATLGIVMSAGLVAAQAIEMVYGQFIYYAVKGA